MSCPNKILHKKSDAYTDYKLLQKYPTYVELNITHNHKPTQADVLKYRRPSNDTIATFYELFDKGHTVSTARDLRLEELKSLAEKEGLDAVMITTDSSLYPPA